jgi:uncharacterized protein YyaL (SSP411 family)
MDYAMEQFNDEDQLFYYYTPAFQEDMPVRKKDMYDGAIPSGNSIMAWNLYRLGLLFDQQDWIKRATSMLQTLLNLAVKYPTSYGIWANLLLELSQGTHEILVVGDNAFSKTKVLLAHYIPNKVFMATETAGQHYPLMEGRLANGDANIFVCHNYSCSLPFASVEETLEHLLTRR